MDDLLKPAWLDARPRLRAVNVTYQRLEGRSVYVVEDPGSSAFYKVGEREFRFLEALDGTRSVGEILARGGEGALDLPGALRLLEMLRAEGLLDEPGAAPGRPSPPWLDRIGSLLFWRISLGDPDRFFAALSAFMGWAVHPLAYLAGTGLIVLGILTVARHSARARDATLGVLAPHNWIWIAAIFIVLRVIHEVWHGLTCRTLGGRVRDIGVLMILFFPLGYTDVTSSWGMPSRWHRFLISGAGIFIELVIAAAAVLVWAATGPGLLNTLAWQTAVTAGAASLLGNLNPLMRFDGYYMMTDLLDLPNLYTRGQIVTRAFARRFLLGMRDQPLPPLRERGWRAAALYGPASWLWRVFVVANLLAATGALFRGAGIVLALLLLVAWFRRPVAQAARWLVTAPAAVKARAAVRTLAVAGVAAAALLVPWTSSVVEPALVDWADRADVYSGCPGFLQDIAVDSGTPVDSGAVLAHLENPDLRAEADRLRIRVQKEDVRARIALRDDDLPSWTASKAAGDALRRDLERAEEKVVLRTIASPSDGVVSRRRLDRRLGQYAKEGEHLLTIGHATERDAVALISQELHARYGLRVGDDVDVWIPGRSGRFKGRVQSISPAAHRQVDFPALTATGGGHLTVRPLPSKQDEPAFELHDPQFEVRVRLSGADALLAGERAYIRAPGRVPIPLWRRAYGGLERFWGGLLNRRS